MSKIHEKMSINHEIMFIKSSIKIATVIHAELKLIKLFIDFLIAEITSHCLLIIIVINVIFS